MDDKHTPGPWQPDGLDVHTGDSLIARCNEGWNQPGFERQAEANARLIAAAPTLLEALRGALPALAHEMGEQHPVTVSTRAAINLATTGEES